MNILAYFKALAWKTAQDPVEDGFIDEVL